MNDVYETETFSRICQELSIKVACFTSLLNKYVVLEHARKLFVLSRNNNNNYNCVIS